MRKPHKVAAQFLGPSQQRLRIFVGVGAASAIRRLGVNVDAAQEDRLSIQQYFGATRFDGAETDKLTDGVVASANLDLIKFRGFGGPALQVFALSNESLRGRRRLLFRSCVTPSSRNFNVDFVARLAIDRHVPNLQSTSLLCGSSADRIDR